MSMGGDAIIDCAIADIDRQYKKTKHRGMKMAKIGVSLKINCSMIDKARLFAGQKGHYLDATVFIDTDELNQYGNSGMITQDVSKEEKQQGVKGNILGNCKVFWKDQQQGGIGGQPQHQQQAPQQAPQPQQMAPQQMAPQQQQAPQMAPQGQLMQPQTAQSFNNFDDDIPF